MADLETPAQEVEIVNQTTGNKCAPDALGRLPVLAVLEPRALCLDGNLFVATVSNFSTGSSSEAPMLLFRNTSVTKYVYFDSFTFDVTSGTSSNRSIVRFYYNATVTGNGTGITHVNAKLGSGNATDTASGYSPSVSANGTLFMSSNMVTYSSTVVEFKLGLILAPGQNIYLTSNQNLGGVICNISYVWAEV